MVVTGTQFGNVGLLSLTFVATIGYRRTCSLLHLKRPVRKSV